MNQDRSWELPESKATPIETFKRRRRLLRMLGLGAVTGGAYGGWIWFRGTDKAILERGRETAAPAEAAPYKVVETSTYDVDRPTTDLAEVARYVNYYEFSPRKAGTWRQAAALPVRPWTLTVDGLVQRPETFDIDQLDGLFETEQRVYRHRCVETWAMVVPWSGFPLRKLIERVQPLDTATHVRFVTADVESLTGIAPPTGFTWPYQEGLDMKEAAHDLSFLATGFYGERLFKQNGAPVRLVVPWKYGFKSAKSIVRIEFVNRRPATFWNTSAPHEYGYYSNVNPDVSHPRWSQATEWMIDTKDRHPTQRYNGYGRWVASMYKGDEV